MGVQMNGHSTVGDPSRGQNPAYRVLNAGRTGRR